MVETHSLSVRYGKVEALSEVSLQVPQSSRVAVLGPNGAGKTTLIKVLATLLRPSSGYAEVFGKDCTKAPDIVRKNLCYVPQDRAVDILLNVRDNLRLFAMLNGIGGPDRDRRVKSALDVLALADKASKTLFQLSGGQVRRVQLSRVFLSDAPLLILDEPTLGVDPKGKRDVWSLIASRANERGTAVLLATNDMAEAETLADTIIFLGNGKVLASGTSSELKSLVAGFSKLRIRCSQPIAAEWPSGLDAELKVKSATIQGDTIEVLLSERALNIAAILQVCRDLGLQIVDVSTPELALDDVFMHFAGRG